MARERVSCQSVSISRAIARFQCCTLAAKIFNGLPLKGFVNALPLMYRWSDRTMSGSERFRRLITPISRKREGIPSLFRMPCTPHPRTRNSHGPSWVERNPMHVGSCHKDTSSSSGKIPTLRSHWKDVWSVSPHVPFPEIPLTPYDSRKALSH